MNGGWNSAGIWPAIELAKTHINQKQDLLKGIKLEVDIKDSKVNDCSLASEFKLHDENIICLNVSCLSHQTPLYTSLIQA
jgi:hypothetical protein